jgi:hypothetical protein
VRRSRIYEVTASNALRIAIELVGGVQPAETGAADAPGAARVAVQKAAGNVLELGSMAAFGFSPLWLLAGAADVLNGTRVYLRTLEAELAAAGVLSAETHFTSVDQLIGALEGAAGTPPRSTSLRSASGSGVALELCRRTLGSSPGDLARLYAALVTLRRRAALASKCQRGWPSSRRPATWGASTW